MVPGLGWGQPAPAIARFSLTLVARMSQMWCHSDTVPTSTACPRLLTLIDNF